MAGALLGTALQAWLRVDIVPVAVRLLSCAALLRVSALRAVRVQGLSSPAVLISETVILGLWAGCTLFA